jgi:hypothetical protein
LKRTTLIAAALCAALAAFSSFAEDKMQDGRTGAMERDAMGKPDSHDKMGKSDRMGKSDKMGKRDKMGKTDKMDKMEKPGAM